MPSSKARGHRFESPLDSQVDWASYKFCGLYGELSMVLQLKDPYGTICEKKGISSWFWVSISSLLKVM